MVTRGIAFAVIAIALSLSLSSAPRAHAAPTKYPTPAEVSALGDGVEAAIALYNLHRAAAGSPPATFDDTASAGARAHVAYMLNNEKLPLGHFEDPSLPGYSADGDRAARSSSIGTGFPNAAACVQGLLGIPYHRLRFLQPGVERVRLAFDRSPTNAVCVFGIASFNSAANSGASRATTPLIYPADGATDVPLTVGGESPDPLTLCRDAAGATYRRPAGFAVTMEFLATARGLRADSSSLTTADGASVEHCVINAEAPHPDHAAILAPGVTSGGWPGTLLVLPRQPLRAGTQYQLKVQGDSGASPFSIQTSFTTMDFRAFTGDVPSTGRIGLLVAGQDGQVSNASSVGVTVPTLLDELTRKGCSASSLWQVKNGKLVGYVVGAPDAVNRAFPDLTFSDGGRLLPLLRSGRPFIAACR